MRLARDRSGGIVMMAVVLVAIICLVFALVWYAFNGSSKARPTTVPSENVINID